MTSQVLNRCGSYQDASLRFVDDLSVGQTKCISPGQDFVIPSPSIKLDSDDFVGDQSALAMLQQANVKFVEILSHIGALFRQSIQLAIILEEALWNGKVVPAVQPYVSSRLIELVTSRTTWVWEESMGGVDVLVDEYGFIASAIAEASDTASAADLVANQVQSYQGSSTKWVQRKPTQKEFLRIFDSPVHITTTTFCCLTRCLQDYSMHFPPSGDVHIPEMVGV